MEMSYHQLSDTICASDEGKGRSDVLLSLPFAPLRTFVDYSGGGRPALQAHLIIKLEQDGASIFMSRNQDRPHNAQLSLSSFESLPPLSLLCVSFLSFLYFTCCFPMVEHLRHGSDFSRAHCNS